MTINSNDHEEWIFDQSFLDPLPEKLEEVELSDLSPPLTTQHSQKPRSHFRTNGGSGIDAWDLLGAWAG